MEVPSATYTNVSQNDRTILATGGRQYIHLKNHLNIRTSKIRKRTKLVCSIDNQYTTVYLLESTKV